MDDKYFLSNIVNVYSDNHGDHNNLFRFIETKELRKLFENREWRFTNPSTWKPTDHFETHFEGWWNSKENLTMWLKIYKETMEAAYQKVGISVENTWMLSSVVFFGKLLPLLQPTYCSCLTSNWRTSKEIHHDVWGKNILLCYKKSFWTKLSLFATPLPFGQDHLYADIFPMHYIDNFEDFIEDVCSTISPKQQDDKILNKGPFLKHSSFCKEDEVRIRLSIQFQKYFSLYGTSFLAQDFHINRVNDFEAFTIKCLEYFKAVNLFYKQKIKNHPNIHNENHFYLKTPQETSLADIIDSIQLSNKISDADKELVWRLANQENIKVEMNAF